MQSYDAKLVRMKARQRSGIASFEFVSLKHRDSLKLTKVVSEKPKFEISCKKRSESKDSKEHEVEFEKVLSEYIYTHMMK